MKSFVKKYERHLSSGALFAGFIFDLVTLVRIDIIFDAIVFMIHIGVISVSISIIALYEGRKYTGKFFQVLRRVAPFFLQFSFGAFFSGLTVFYLRSASITSAILFLLLLIGLLIGNEFFRNRYQRVIFQFSLFFIGTTSFFILYLPVLTKTIGAGVFISATLLALVLIFTLFKLLAVFVSDYMKKAQTGTTVSIGMLFVLIQVLYFTNSIPPVPLILKDAQIYHQVYRDRTTYYGVEESRLWYQSFLKRELNYVSGEQIAFYSSVFAPTALSTTISHLWEYKNPKTGAWENRGQISFDISGGRGGGYRGYTQKTAIESGEWRVSVLTNRGQVIGRTYFRLFETQFPAQTKEVKL